MIIERDEETKKIQASIKAGMSANASHLQSYLSTWDRYEPCTVNVLKKTLRLAVVLNKLFKMYSQVEKRCKVCLMKIVI